MMAIQSSDDCPALPARFAWQFPYLTMGYPVLLHLSWCLSMSEICKFGRIQLRGENIASLQQYAPSGAARHCDKSRVPGCRSWHPGEIAVKGVGPAGAATSAAA